MGLKLFLSLALAACGLAVPFEERGEVSRLGYLSFPIEHRRSSLPITKRADTNVPLLNVSAISYLIELSIGTPGQRVKVAIDTGSDELWVNPECANVSNAQQRAECEADGKYNPSRSSSAERSQATSFIPYGKGEVTIQYYRDDITVPESTISLRDVIFGVALTSKDLNEGIIGLGYGNGTNMQYNNFIDELAVQNVTLTRAFTVALGSAEANNGGVIIFGGVDTKKFTGRLAQLPILPPQGRETVRRYWVQMDSVGITPQSGAAKTYPSSSMPIVLDSGSSLSYLPAAVVSQMANDTGARWDATNDLYIVPCAQASSSSTFDFVFSGGARISVPFKEFIWQAGSNTCVLGALPLQQGAALTALLGDTFMRSAYTVFDQTGNSVYVAQYANCGQSEQVITAQQGSLAGFSGECSATNATGARNGGGRTALGGREPRDVLFGSVAALVVVQVVLSLL